MRAVLVLALLGMFVLPACSTVEKICDDGKVAVEREGGGRSCEDSAPGDEDCPDGEILLKNPDVGVEGCIPNEYSADSYTDQLTSTNSG
jgi:hypothetical protein